MVERFFRMFRTGYAYAATSKAQVMFRLLFVVCLPVSGSSPFIRVATTTDKFDVDEHAMNMPQTGSFCKRPTNNNLNTT